MRKAKIFLINGVILTSTALLLRGIGLIFNIYVANKVGSQTIGIFSLIMSVYTFAITVATSGISVACTYIVSEEFAKKNYFNGIKAVKTCTLFAVLLGLVSCFIICLFSPIITTYWLKGAVSNKPLYVIGIGLPLIAVSSVLGGYFSSVGKSYKSAISQVLEVSVKIIITIFLLQINISKGIEEICFSLILADVIAEFFSFSLNVIFYIIDKRKYCNKRNLPIQMKRKIFKISFPIAVTSYMKSGLSSLKQFLIPLRLEASGIAYSMAVSSYGLINGMVMPVLMFANVFISSFSSLLIPEFSRLLAKNYNNRMKTVSDTIFKLTFVFSILVSSIFLFFANDLSLAIYQNLEVAKWIRILSPLVFFMYVDSIIDGILKGINEQVGVMVCNILDLIITITLIYFIVPILGMKGYIITICVSEIFNFIVSTIQLKGRIKFSINILDYVLKPIIASLIAFSGSSIFNFNFFNNTINIIFKICIFVLIYFLALFLSRTKKKRTTHLIVIILGEVTSNYQLGIILI